MDEEQPQEWTTPEFVALTDTEGRADEADIPVRNGGVSGPG